MRSPTPQFWNRSPALTAVLTAACASFVALAIWLPERWSYLFLAPASAFLFALLANALLVAQDALLYRKLVGLFGRELVMDTTTLIYPEFKIHAEVQSALNEHHYPMRYQKSTERWKDQVHAIDLNVAVAKQDIQALVEIAALFHGAPAVLRVRSDVEAGTDKTEPGESFVSIGLSSNDVTYLYFDRTGDRTLFHLTAGETPGYGEIITWGGKQFVASSDRDYGIIVRCSPDRSRWPDRRWFIIGGIGTAGTLAAATYLRDHWRDLLGAAGRTRDFVAVVPTNKHTAQPAAPVQVFPRRPGLLGTATKPKPEAVAAAAEKS